MANGTSTFTHVGIKKETQRKIALIAAAQDVNIYDLVDFWATSDWNSAVRNGLVTEAMLHGAKNARVEKDGINSTSVLKKAEKGSVRRGASKAARNER
jgi:hypothetical protein